MASVAMMSLVLRRLLALPLILLAVAVTTFLVVHLSPFDPVDAYVGAETLMSPEARAEIARAWGLDRSPPEQLVRWLGRVVQGDLGASLVKGGRPVTQVIADRAVLSAILAASALVVVLVGGLLAGVAAAAFRDSWFDWLVRGTSYFSIASPSFWVALLALYIFAVWLNWLPGAGVADLRSLDMPRLDLRHLVLPVLTLALTQFAWFTMFMRDTLLEVMREDYVRFAQAQGLSRAAILFRHALPNALIPFVTLIGVNIPELIGGSVLIETIFAWPGLGALTQQAALGVDVPLLVALVLMGSTLVVVGNLVADLACRILDPRVREALR